MGTAKWFYNHPQTQVSLEVLKSSQEVIKPCWNPRHRKIILDVELRPGNRFTDYNLASDPKMAHIPLWTQPRMYLFGDLVWQLPIPGAGMFMCWVSDQVTIFLGVDQKHLLRPKSIPTHQQSKIRLTVQTLGVEERQSCLRPLDRPSCFSDSCDSLCSIPSDTDQGSCHGTFLET